jgi:dTDP-4-amino-4,6-dideoxygalactose transaminase
LQIKAENRDNLMAHLKSCDIGVGLHYAEALPFLNIYYNKKAEEEFPLAFANQSKILSLPIFPDITNMQIEYVVNCIIKFYKSN